MPIPEPQQPQQVLPPVIPPPDGNLSDVPDSDTKIGLKDWTGPEAHNRVLFINLRFLRYGTDDRSHAASIFMSLLLLGILAILMVIGLWATNLPFLEKTVGWIESIFLIVAGVAIGRGGKENGSSN